MEIVENLLDTAKKQYQEHDYTMALETMRAAVKLLRAGVEAREKIEQGT